MATDMTLKIPTLADLWRWIRRGDSLAPHESLQPSVMPSPPLSEKADAPRIRRIRPVPPMPGVASPGVSPTPIVSNRPAPAPTQDQAAQTRERIAVRWIQQLPSGTPIHVRTLAQVGPWPIGTTWHLVQRIAARYPHLVEVKEQEQGGKRIREWYRR
ncbi:hypothetical protein TPY_2644 [Sulfobacillus acidophilus TPY]|uniref:Uncharacterized protein n=1 Tax=Sulfobacillus acidophilus (strain ATCC 700253 / DSM 10332 / NAL) TaxID=679936 RepID=G8TV96_SULAD|nr:hypothetical protein TPY_2644 [Sulfobacillus acidophilus TPY]AEW04736.1 hypothetical protein Sulac_1236 [Sulfobacillus acidophilus DSM 10332]